MTTAARTIAWGYFGFGFVLALLLLNSNSKRIAVKEVSDSEEEDKVSRLDFRKRAAG